MSVATLVERIARVPGVKAVTLGGSRARGMARPDSDWDIGLYYRGGIDTDAVRALGYPGHVAEPGDWGRIVNGGAWLEVDRERVDLLYRDLDVVEHWIAEADAGRFEIDRVGGHIVGLPAYVLAGELALGTVLRGSLPRPSFSPALRRSGRCRRGPHRGRVDAATAPGLRRQDSSASPPGTRGMRSPQASAVRRESGVEKTLHLPPPSPP